MEELEERWFPITWAPDYYVSNLGRVLSSKFGRPKFLKEAHGGRYCLRIDGKKKKYTKKELLDYYAEKMGNAETSPTRLSKLSN